MARVLCACWQSYIRRLNEKIHFLGFLFWQVVHKHYLGEVKNIASFDCLLSLTFLPIVIKISSFMSKLQQAKGVNFYETL